MIIIDTHIWIWWINKHEKLTAKNLNIIETYCNQGLGISIISCWEVAKLVEKNRLKFECDVRGGLNYAVVYPHVQLL